MIEATATNDQNRLLRASDVADMLGVTSQTVRRLSNRGHLPPGRRIGPKTVRWPAREISRFIENAPLAKPNATTKPKPSQGETT